MQGTSNAASWWDRVWPQTSALGLLCCLHPTFHLFFERYFSFVIPFMSSLKFWFLIRKSFFRMLDGMINNVTCKCDVMLGNNVSQRKEQSNRANTSWN